MQTKLKSLVKRLFIFVAYAAMIFGAATWLDQHNALTYDQTLLYLLVGFVASAEADRHLED